MNVEVNWLAVVLATASSMIVGAAWYAKATFGTMWMKLVKLTPKQAAKGGPGPIIITAVVSFLTAYVLAHVSYLSNQFFQHTFLQDSLTTAFWLWLGLTAARFITHDAFEHRPVRLTILNIMHELVTLMVMAAIIGSLQP